MIFTEISDIVARMADRPSDLTLDIHSRNRIRAEAGLPLLNADRELAIAIAGRKRADFEQAFAAHCAIVGREWGGIPNGWMTGLGLWSLARERFRTDRGDVVRADTK